MEPVYVRHILCAQLIIVEFVRQILEIIFFSRLFILICFDLVSTETAEELKWIGIQIYERIFVYKMFSTETNFRHHILQYFRMLSHSTEAMNIVNERKQIYSF